MSLLRAPLLGAALLTLTDCSGSRSSPRTSPAGESPGLNLRNARSNCTGEPPTAGSRPVADPTASLSTSKATPPQLVLQAAHTDDVRALAFSPDGRILVSAGADKQIKVWETETGALLHDLIGHTDTITSLVFHPSGRLVISASDDRSLRFWDLDRTGTGTAVRLSADGVGGVIPSLAVSGDGKLLACAVTTRIELRDARNGTLLRALEGHKEFVRSVTFSADGRRVISASVDGTVRRWDAQSGAGEQLAGGLASAEDAVFSPDGGSLIVAGADDRAGTIMRYSIGDRLPRWKVGAHGERAISVSLAPGGELLASGGDDRTIKLWDPGTGRLLRSIDAHRGRMGWVRSVVFSPDGKWLASASEDHTVKLWDPGSGKLVRGFGAAAHRAESVSFVSDGGTVVVGGLGPDGDVQLWDAVSGALVETLSSPIPRRAVGISEAEERRTIANIRKDAAAVDRAGFQATGVRIGFTAGAQWGYSEAIQQLLIGFPVTVRSLALSSDEKTLITGSLNRTVQVWDLASMTLRRSLTAHSGVVRSVAFSPKGDRFASAGEDGTLKLWDAKSHYLVGKVPAAKDRPILALGFSSDGSLLASGDDDRYLRLWEASSGRFLRELEGHERGIYAVGFLEAGRFAVSASGDGTVRIWDTKTGWQVEKLDQSGWPVALAVSSDERLLAVGTYEGDVKVWDACTGAHLRTLTGHVGPVWSVAFQPRTNLLASSGDDGTLRFWDVGKGNLLATATGSGREWLVTSPDGLFDGSPAAWGRTRWRFSQKLEDTAPVEVFFGEFYYPGLLADLLAGKRPSAPRDMRSVDRRQPRVRIAEGSPAKASSSPESRKSASLVIDVEQSGDARDGSGARDLRLFRNGVLVRTWRGDLLAQGKNQARQTVEIPLVAGENLLTAYAFNRDNVKSLDAAITIDGGKTGPRRTAYIVSIGINEYANPAFNLAYAVPDAKAFADELRARQEQLKVFDRVEVISLTNREATRAGILETIAGLAGKGRLRAGPEDAVFIYYAGHGTADGDRFYLIPHDLGFTGRREGMDRAQWQTVLGRSISDRDLEKAIEPIDVGNILLVIDACNSGQALEAEEKRRGPLNSRGLAQLAYEKGMSVLTAAQGYQAALEAERLGHGYLTYALIQEGLKTAAADRAPRNGDLLMREWLDYATIRVPQMQEEGARDARRLGRGLTFVDAPGGSRNGETALQRPRLYYRRDVENLLVARVPQGASQNTPTQ